MFTLGKERNIGVPSATMVVSSEGKAYPITKAPTERRGRKTPETIQGSIYQMSYAPASATTEKVNNSFSLFKLEWIRQEGTPFMDRLIQAVEDNGISLQPYAYGLRGLRKRVEWTLLERRVKKAITVSRSATILDDANTQDLMLFYTDVPGIRHQDITNTVGETYFEGLFGDDTRTLSSGHLADIQLRGVPATTIFVSDRIYTSKYEPFSDQERAFARKLERQGIILVSSDGVLVK